MSRKLLIALLLALLLSVTAGQAVLAAQDDSPELRHLRRGFGEIIAIGDEQFTVENRRGEFIILVDEDTEFKTHDGDPASFNDLEVGNWVGGSAKPTDGDALLAKLVILLPEDFDPSDIPGRKLRGELLSVNETSETFELETSQGEVFTIATDENTRYVGALNGFEDLKTGSHVLTMVKQTDAGLLALAVASGKGRAERRYAGALTDVDEAASEFTIETRRGESKTFLVDEDTKFLSREGEVQDLEDLEVGMHLGVGASLLDDGSLLAHTVAVAPEALVDAERARGEVTAVGADNFSIETHAGDELSFEVADRTRFLSRDKSFGALEDLEVGDLVAVAYTTLGGSDGLKALLVVKSLKDGGDST